jgi:hypothetical protein
MVRIPEAGAVPRGAAGDGQPARALPATIAVSVPPRTSTVPGTGHYALGDYLKYLDAEDDDDDAV